MNKILFSLIFLSMPLIAFDVPHVLQTERESVAQKTKEHITRERGQFKNSSVREFCKSRWVPISAGMLLGFLARSSGNNPCLNIAPAFFVGLLLLHLFSALFLATDRL